MNVRKDCFVRQETMQAMGDGITTLFGRKNISASLFFMVTLSTVNAYASAIRCDMTDMDSHLCDCCLVLNPCTYGPNIL